MSPLLPSLRRSSRAFGFTLFFLLLLALPFTVARGAFTLVQTDLNTPIGSAFFGQQITLLPNGNFVVVDMEWRGARGAAWLYDGRTLEPINWIHGADSGDRVGAYGVTVLSNGNFVVQSGMGSWGHLGNTGAATWGSALTGFINGGGVVGPHNSLVGSNPRDLVGYRVTPLVNGHYVVLSPWWSNGDAQAAGAATFGNGETGTVGYVSPENSLVGTRTFDMGDEANVVALEHGHYLVVSPHWSSPTVEQVGAVTVGDGLRGTVGEIGPHNSLVGSQFDDSVGRHGVVALADGSYVVISAGWSNGDIWGAGAVTWGDRNGRTKGPVTPENSLVGTQRLDGVGGGGVLALTNGNYVVLSPAWQNGTVHDAGAATWGNGEGGTVGAVTPANSLVGTQAVDGVGFYNSVALPNGNYVVMSPYWNNGTAQRAGAATWGNGEGGTVGPVTTANSLVGAQTDDRVGSNPATALTNGNYLVVSPEWKNSDQKAVGSVTWGSGNGGTVGQVGATNSLTGSYAGDLFAVRTIALTNGNYVVAAPFWTSGFASSVGAVTWGNGATGTSGAISPANSLTGSSALDFVGWDAHALFDGNFAVQSPFWDNGSAENVGAVTWSSGVTPTVGAVSPSNSLVGATEDQTFGWTQIIPASNGDFIVVSPDWDTDGSAEPVGAVTWVEGNSAAVGAASAESSVLGKEVGSGYNIYAHYNPVYNYVLVGFPNEQRIVVAGTQAYTLTVAANGPGKIRSRVGGIDCEDVCATTAISGTTVVLEAWPDAYSQVQLFSPCYDATTICQVRMNGNQNASAEFVETDDPGRRTGWLPFVGAGQE